MPPSQALEQVQIRRRRTDHLECGDVHANFGEDGFARTSMRASFYTVGTWRVPLTVVGRTRVRFQEPTNHIIHGHLMHQATNHTFWCSAYKTKMYKSQLPQTDPRDALRPARRAVHKRRRSVWQNSDDRQNDRFCVKWDIKASAQSINQKLCTVYYAAKTPVSRKKK